MTTLIGEPDYTNGNQTALGMVNEAHDKFLDKADERMTLAQKYAQDLANFHTTPTNWNVDFNFDAAGLLTPFARPTSPTFNAADYALNTPLVPEAPAAFSPQDVPLDDLPVFDMAAPTIAFAPKPNTPNIVQPIAPDRPNINVMPEEPDWENPVPVSLLSLNLPQMPSVVLPTFNSTRPTLEAFNVNDDFSHFTPQAYVSQLLNSIKQRVSTWLLGEEALPIAIERALFDRGRGRIEVERLAAEDQVFDDYASRGFAAPSGLLAARLDAVRSKAQDQKAEFNRDTSIKSFEEALANMRLAVQSGIQLEGVTINLHIEEQKLVLASLTHLRDTAVALLNARIAHFNAEMQGVQIDAQIFETQLKAELSKLDLLRAQIDAEKLKGDINQQSVDLYKTQWGAVQTMASFYSERVNAAKLQLEAAKLPIEIFAEETRAFETQWSAYGKQIDGWKAEIEGETSKTLLYKTAADAYASRVDGVVRSGGLKMDKEKLRLAQHGQQLETYRTVLARVGQLVDLETARLGSVTARDRARTDVFRAEADLEGVASAAADRQFNSLLTAYRAGVDVELEEARIKSQENSQLQALILEAMKAMAQVMSQLASSTMSSVSYSANAGFSGSYSTGKSVSWSGEAPDYTGL